MASKHLTDAAVKAAVNEAVETKKRRDISDRVQRGLVLRVTPTGAASFAFAYRAKGQKVTQRITLGPYPAVKLAEAREKAGDYHKQVARGLDPRAEMKREAEADAAAAVEKASRVTVTEAIEQYLTIKIRRERSRDGARSSLFKDVVPAVGAKALADLTRKDMQKIIAGIEARGSMTQSRLTLAYTKAMLNWHIERGTIDAHEIAALKVARRSQPRERVLSVLEVRAFWRLLPDLRMYDAERDILRLQLLLGQRVGEVAGMMRHEVDLERKVWTLAGERTKNGDRHEVPLGPMAQEIVGRAMQAQRGKLLFPRTDGEPISPNAVATSLLRGQGVFDFKSADGEPNPFTSHDLRRTCATLMERGGTPRNIVSAVLNHRDGKNVTTVHYLHNDEMREKRLALLMWERNLRTILAGTDPFVNSHDDPDELERQIMQDAAPAPALANVVPLRGFR